MNYKIIGSGSDGNAVIIENKILIDCGLPYKKIEKDIKNVEIVLLTHIHQDHFNARTISTIAIQNKKIEFVCGKWLVENLVRCGVGRDRIYVLNFNVMYDFGDFKVGPIKLYHDVENQGYRAFIKDFKYIYATDTNTLDGISAKNYDAYLIEANYEEKQLEKELKESEENGEFNYRKRVPKTHLSKEQCLEFFFNNCKTDSILEFMHVHKER